MGNEPPLRPRGQGGKEDVRLTQPPSLHNCFLSPPLPFPSPQSPLPAHLPSFPFPLFLPVRKHMHTSETLISWYSGHTIGWLCYKTFPFVYLKKYLTLRTMSH